MIPQAMHKVDALPELSFGRDELTLGADRIPYESIEHIDFLYGDVEGGGDMLHAGPESAARLGLVLTGGRQVVIDSDLGVTAAIRNLRGEGLHQAWDILSRLTFRRRMDETERALRSPGGLELGAYTLHATGDVREDGAPRFSLADTSISVEMDGIFLHCRGTRKGFFKRGDDSIPVLRDRDCVLAVLERYFGLAMEHEDYDPSALPTGFYYEAILRLGAKLCKADGRVSPDEAVSIKEHFGISDEEFPNARRIFNTAAAGPASAPDEASDILATAGNNRSFLEYITHGLLKIAHADGEFDTTERDFIHRVCRVFGFSEDEIRDLWNLFGAEPDPILARAPDPESAEVKLAILGCTPAGSPDDVRAAYRALVRKHHPVILAGAGIPLTRLPDGDDVLTRINDAYAWLEANYLPPG
jgi:DnaJ-domain-containing protein 1